MIHRLLSTAALALPILAFAGEFPAPFDTEPASAGPMKAEEAAASIELPPGFRASVFAAEPDVRQPIAMCFDSRGRLWVAECYTYAERATGYDLRLRDRIVIFEDTKNSGHFDKRTVFWDGAQRLTSIAVGMDGVYALCLPNLLFVPDRNHDDIPDGPPEVLLEGFDYNSARHTMANGLKWGPDGWLYGRQGILAGNLSQVGPPGAAASERKRIGCGIWRYHPTRRLVEPLTEGTTNPWGMDWNEDGEAFFVNTVIGHLWHMIPGAHYRRMFGEDPAPHIYGLIEQHADHLHWDASERWDEVRTLGVTSASSRAGGGHAHTGLLCYLGNNWPASYRGKLFTINFHGRRLNTERLEREGSGYVGRRGDDLCFVKDDWFRGIDLLQGPDGGVFVADWSDSGECHDNNGIHRNSGRIYKLSYGEPQKLSIADVADLGAAELAAALEQSDEWLARQAQRVLQARAARGEDCSAAHREIARLLGSSNSTPVRLRAVWALYVSGGMDVSGLRGLLHDTDEHVRTWAIRLLSDELFPPTPATTPPGAPADAVLAEFKELAANDSSPLVRLALASLLQRLPVEGARSRADLAAALLGHAEDATDHNLPLMLWYGIAPLRKETLLEHAKATRIPLIRRFVARRLAEGYDESPGALSILVAWGATQGEGVAEDALAGMAEGFSGRRKVAPPADWASFRDRFGENEKLASRVRDLSALFGDGRALDHIQATALDESLDIATRRAALKTLIDARWPELRALCEKLLDVRDLSATAATGLGLFDDPAIASLLIKKYPTFYGHERPSAIAVLSSRPAFASLLLDAVGANSIPRSDISTFLARQIRSFNDPELTAKLNTTWGEIHDSAADKAELIRSWKARLTPDVLAGGDKPKGRALFNQICATCHKLYGEGAAIGPDLTGAGRSSLDYLLENIGDPSAIVPAEYRLVVITLKDGRTLAGIIAAKSERSITLQTIGERATIERSDIASLSESSQSLMPDGLLQALAPDQVRDLIAYLMDSVQSPLPVP